MHIKSLTLLALIAALTTTPQVVTASGPADDSHVSKDIGRLFTTRSERDNLDNSRKKESTSRRLTTTRSNEADALKVNGVVSTRSGKTKVWLNGQQASDAKVNVLFDPRSSTGEIDLYLLELQQMITLQPGQTYTRSSKQTLDTFETIPRQEGEPQ